MSVVQSFYEADSFYERLTLRLVRERIGHCLRERYHIPKQLPPKLIAAVRKLEVIESKPLQTRTLIGTLDAAEGNQLLRYRGMPSDYERMVEARTVGGVKAFPDWFVLT
jgi:hypothetical protein